MYHTYNSNIYSALELFKFIEYLGGKGGRYKSALFNRVYSFWMHEQLSCVVIVMLNNVKHCLVLLDIAELWRGSGETCIGSHVELLGAYF